LICSATVACNDDAPDGTGLVIETSASQPNSPEFGVALEVHARGGQSVALTLERGSFVASTAPDKLQPPATTACVASPSPGLDAPFTIPLSVRPAESEAMLFAALYTLDDCSGPALQSRLIAVRPPATNAVDAGVATGGGN